jgi:hypothetical protein
MPFLPLALRDVLKQSIKGNVIELVATEDCGTDDSLRFLLQLVDAMNSRQPGSAEIIVDGDGPENQSAAAASNPALLLPPRSQSAEISASEASNVPPSIAEIYSNPLTPVQVAESINVPSGVRFKLVLQETRVNVGQGGAMSRCLKYTEGSKYIGFMESDDEREDNNLAEMVRTLEEEGGGVADAVVSDCACIGWEREGMVRYVEWQNSFGTLTGEGLR